MLQEIKPIIIGLPGVGKSTTSQIIGKSIAKSVISTDVLFRIYRAIPLNSKENGHQIMQNFLQRARQEFPDEYSTLLKYANRDPDDPKGRCKLRDSKLFRKIGAEKYGERIFRTFEIEMNKWLNAEGEFDHKIPDLSASAALYDENRKIFSKENGFTVVLLDIAHETLVDRLMNDYKKHLALSEEAGEIKHIRGAYEMAVERALENFEGKEGKSGKNADIRKALSEKSLEDRANRMNQYEKFADFKILVNETDTPELLADKVFSMIQTA